MKFSIILTIDKNKNKDTLEKCLNSILKQTYKDFEIILLSDDSSIDINQICKKYSEQYSDNIIYLRQKSVNSYELPEIIKFSSNLIGSKKNYLTGSGQNYLSILVQKTPTNSKNNVF